MAHVVVGLGNPGPEYRDTRHNIGQRVVDHLAQQLKKAWHPDGRALVARGSWRGDALYLVKPQSFMNVSGPSVRHVLLTLGAGPEDLMLVYDDIDMALGKVRTRLRGSAGGHNGVQSVIDARSVPWSVTRLGARAEYWFSPSPRNGAEAAAAVDEALDSFMHLWALNRGILLTPFHNMALMSPSTTAADVDAHTAVFADAVAAIT